MRTYRKMLEGISDYIIVFLTGLTFAFMFRPSSVCMYSFPWQTMNRSEMVTSVMARDILERGEEAGHIFLGIYLYVIRSCMSTQTFNTFQLGLIWLNERLNMVKLCTYED